MYVFRNILPVILDLRDLLVIYRNTQKILDLEFSKTLCLQFNIIIRKNFNEDYREHEHGGIRACDL